jgi:hypothetical protein
MRGRRILLTLAAITGLVTMAAPAAAQPAPLPTVGDQPAATLLLPYFEVDLANPAGANTYFTINNASASAGLAHITIWSAMHVPVHTVDVYLTGYDVQQINVRDLINGVLPRTASDGQDPTDTNNPNDGISNQGALSQDINFFSCNAGLPPAAVPQATIDHIRAALTGQQSPLTGMCATKGDGTRIARGYITVDDMTGCTSMTPADPGYFVAGGAGIAGNRNIWWGDYTYTNHIGGLESGDAAPLVHITASATDPETSVPGEYTFYGRFVGWTAADNREPLSTTFMTHFVNMPAVGKTTLTVWRDARVNQNYFACGTTPSWYPLSHEAVGFFDEQENPELTIPPPFAPPPPAPTVLPFGFGAQRVQVGSTLLPTSFSAGLLYLNLNTFPVGANFAPEDPIAAQAFVSVHLKYVGRYSTGWQATMLDSAKTASHINPGFF